VNLTGTDVDGTVAAFQITGLSADGTIYSDVALTQVVGLNGIVPAAGNAATVYFQPASGWFGPTSFQYAAIDNNGAHDATPALATITVVESEPPMLSVMVSGIAQEGQTLTAT
jgi:hypothetical protein